MHRTLSEYTEEGSWRLLQENAPSHRSTLITNFLIQNRISSVNHVPYSPELAPCDFNLFRKLHLPMKRMRCADIPAIQKACTHVLRRSPAWHGILFDAMPANYEKHHSKKLLSRANKCIETEGTILSKIKQFYGITIFCSYVEKVRFSLRQTLY